MKMFKPQLHDEWHLIDVDRDGMSSVSPSVASTSEGELNKKKILIFIFFNINFVSNF